MNFFSLSRPTLWTALFLACISTINCAGLSCYQCTVAPKPGRNFSNSQICNHFERTGHYQTYCPNSTLCMKRSIRHRLGNGTLVLTSVERGCAPQLLVSQQYDNEKGSWYTKQEIVTSAYDERCFMGEDRGAPGGPPEYCFCSFHLCNGSIAKKIMHRLNFFLVFVLLWIQSIIH